MTGYAIADRKEPGKSPKRRLDLVTLHPPRTATAEIAKTIEDDQASVTLNWLPQNVHSDVTVSRATSRVCGALATSATARRNTSGFGSSDAAARLLCDHLFVIEIIRGIKRRNCEWSLLLRHRLCVPRAALRRRFLALRLRLPASASTRNASLTALEVGNIFATSRSSTTTFAPLASR